MKTIWKYELKVQREQYVKIPYEHNILDIQIQDGKIIMWVEVDKTTDALDTLINMFGTGQELPAFYEGDFLATIQDGRLVWHFYKDA
jgi:glutamine cyclotransferase